jgi:hypothetical protein
MEATYTLTTSMNENQDYLGSWLKIPRITLSPLQGLPWLMTS